MLGGTVISVSGQDLHGQYITFSITLLILCRLYTSRGFIQFHEEVNNSAATTLIFQTRSLQLSMLY
jgi:hypothetical protein